GGRLSIAHRTGTLIERDQFPDKAVAMAVGDRASGISASPNGKLLSVAMGDSGTVALVDMATLRVVKTVRISGRNAERAVFAPDGGSVYASAEDSDSVDVIDVANGTVIKSIHVGHGQKGID